jgi:hypothetical protein
MDNGGPGGGTKSASDNYPLVTWGGGEDLSRRVRWQQCLPMLSQSWFLARKCNTASFLCRPHTQTRPHMPTGGAASSGGMGGGTEPERASAGYTLAIQHHKSVSKQLLDG